MARTTPPPLSETIRKLERGKQQRGNRRDITDARCFQLFRWGLAGNNLVSTVWTTLPLMRVKRR